MTNPKDGICQPDVVAPRAWLAGPEGASPPLGEPSTRERMPSVVEPRRYGESDFIEMLWSMSEKALTDCMKGRTSQADFQTALAVLQAKTLIESRRVARWTRYLTFATFALAVVAALTLVVAVVTLAVS